MSNKDVATDGLIRLNDEQETTVPPVAVFRLKEERPTKYIRFPKQSSIFVVIFLEKRLFPRIFKSCPLAKVPKIQKASLMPIIVKKVIIKCSERLEGYAVCGECGHFHEEKISK